MSTPKNMPSREQDIKDLVLLAEGYLNLIRCRRCNRIQVKDRLCFHCNFGGKPGPDVNIGFAATMKGQGEKMDEKLGYLTAFLATVPTLGLQCFGTSIFGYSEAEDRFTTQFTPANSQEKKEVLETRIERMAKVAEKDLEKIQYWLSQYKIYKETDCTNASSTK